MFQDKEFKRYSKSLQNLLLKIFHDDLEDPNLRRITINYFKLNRTKTSATVYLDLDGTRDPVKALNNLNKLNPFFRKKLFNYLGKFRVPYFRFVRDTVLEKGKRVEQLIEESMIENA